MAKKSNIRSIRFSDELAELIDRQVGNTFTEKFENLITRCVWELPQKQQQLEYTARLINEKKQELKELADTTRKLRARLTVLERKLFEMESEIRTL